MWSKLVNTSVGIIAKEHYDLNRCQYHNWQHILDCYDYLERNSVPYDENLDYAVMHHDIVYDNLPNKEKRSVELMHKKYPNVVGAIDPILATEHHKIRGLNSTAYWMIRADLHQLADTTFAIKNYSKIMEESIWLYNIDVVCFARNNRVFMQSLKTIVYDNYAVDSDKFWLDVAKGIDLTIDMSTAVIKNSTHIQ